MLGTPASVRRGDSPPLLSGAEHRQFGGEQVLDDLAPADAAVNLDEIAAPFDFGAQGAAAFQLAVDLTLQGLHGGEGVRPAHRLLNGSASISFMASFRQNHIGRLPAASIQVGRIGKGQAIAPQAARCIVGKHLGQHAADCRWSKGAGSTRPASASAM